MTDVNPRIIADESRADRAKHDLIGMIWCKYPDLPPDYIEWRLDRGCSRGSILDFDEIGVSIRGDEDIALVVRLWKFKEYEALWRWLIEKLDNYKG